MRVERVRQFGPVTGFQVGYAPIGKPVMKVICYHVGDVLIDTGSYLTRQSVHKLLQNYSIRQILLTHYHEDHAGNAAYLQQQLRVPVYGHPLTRQLLRNKIALKPYEHYIWGKLEPVEIQELAGDFVSGDYVFTPVHTPGHSADHYVYWEKSQGWLFSGDMFLGPKIKYFRSDEDIVITIRSLRQLLELDFDKLFCGHNPQMTDAKYLLRHKADYLQGILDTAADLLRQGCGEREILQRMVKGHESWLTRVVTLGDVGYHHMVRSALANLTAAGR